jgi:3-deoxy-manno-octulosonate cytidylyltransferase (CMP-KDO synthetase)
MKIALIIPARYGSTRFAGKPLALIHGRSMLSYVTDIAKEIADKDSHITIAVATEDQRIYDHATKDLSTRAILTSPDCATGSDRILEAATRIEQQDSVKFDLIIGLQGDAPFTPPHAITALIQKFHDTPDAQVTTPVVQLRWVELDKLRADKAITPFSGTTATIAADGRAFWFSKNIIPAIRGEEKLRTISEFSPVHQHLGIYAFRKETLQKFVTLPQSPYEILEGLEQLRLLENHIPIHTVTLNVDLGLAQAGIDSPEDIVRAEAMISKFVHDGNGL